MKQHVVDPESCIQCSACEMACPNKAITAICGRYCIDFSQCLNCLKCVDDCPTGACDTYIDTDINRIYKVEDQANWVKLPVE